MNNENRKLWYPKDVSDQEAAMLFKEYWTQDYYRRLRWHEEGMESIAGYGTSLGALATTIEELPNILAKYEINSILDAPCGDFYLMKKIDLSDVKYIGIDLVDEQIERNKLLYPSFDFRAMNMVTDELPLCDLVFSRDILIHLSDDDIIRYITNCKKSGIKYLMTSTYPDLAQNQEMGGIHGWRFINFEIADWNFPKPLELINENSQIDPIKCMGLWRLEDLNLNK
jgi:hypothetical protein